MTPEERAKQIAEAIFTEWQASCARYPEGYPSPLEPIVVRHVAASLTPSAGCIGKLPTTTDGVPFARGDVWVNGFLGGKPHVFSFLATARWVGTEPYIAHVWGEKIPIAYSTREAALAAKEQA